jgi:ribosomal protein L12E/L44/L45/RPP1/RPP2
MEQQKLVTVESNGTIIELGGISGPIFSPTLIPISTIVRMINSHRKVMEVNPKNTDEKVRLTLKNVRSVNFAENLNKPIKANVAPTAPVVAANKQTQEVKKDNNNNNANGKTEAKKDDFTKK